MDPSAVEVGNGEVAAVVFAAGDALADALVRPGRVVVHLVFGQDGASEPPRGSSALGDLIHGAFAVSEVMTAGVRLR